MPDAGRSHLVGMISDRDLHQIGDQLELIEVWTAMVAPVTVTPATTTHEAARLLWEDMLNI
jgi:CBS domain-containing protein